jgi:hypothetical protein
MNLNDNVQPLDEFVLEKSGALGPAKDWTDMCGHALDTVDSMIATAGTVPDLLHETPLYVLNALRTRFHLFNDVISHEQARRAANTSDDPNPMRDADLSSQLETHSRTVRDLANARATAWLNGIDPDAYLRTLAETVTDSPNGAESGPS